MNIRYLNVVIAGITAVLMPFHSYANAATDSVASSGVEWSYFPKFHGVMRTFYELSTATGQSKFMVRNARLNVGGFILPKVDYFVQADFCDRGSICLLDAYARLYPAEGLQIYAGQCRVPFSVESSRQPQMYHFADVGLVATLGNLRSVGVKAGYCIPSTPIYVEGGIFNGSDRSDHKEWNSQMTYSIKANCTVAGFKPEVAFMSRVPGGQDGTARFNQGNVSLSWTCGGFMIEGEYIYRGYNGSDDDVQAWDLFADYGFDVDWNLANKLSFQARYDGVTDGPGIVGRKRLTIGSTAHYSYNKVFMDFRLNFEQYFYGSNVSGISPSDNNKLVGGVILYF